MATHNEIYWFGPLDLYEVSLLLGACFLVNYVTADAKTNWAGKLFDEPGRYVADVSFLEGFILSAFYIMIVSCSFCFWSFWKVKFIWF